MKKIEVTTQIKNEIYEKYLTGMTIRKIVNEYPYSFNVIYKIIKSIDFEKNITLNYPVKDGYKMIAICKKTNKEFDDYKNISGALTTHILENYNIKLLSKFKRKKIEYDTNKFWYDEYFDFKNIKKSITKKCVFCDWETEDINNLSGAYEKHLKNIHNMKIRDYVIQYPDEKKYFKKDFYEKLITCKICGNEYKYITNSHLKKHNISQLEYKLKYGVILVSDETKKKLLNNYKLYLKNSPNIKTSKLESLIIENIPVNFIQSDRKILNGKEIDLLYNNNGFELNGCVFHTEIFGNKNRNYHLNKTENALKNGVNLYHVFEDELYYKTDIVFQKIKHILNIANDNEIIHARKCNIDNMINTKQKSIFLNENHIQGNDKSNITLSASFNDEIVAVMCFDNKRHLNKSNLHNSNIYELTRFCVKKNTIISGIADRLLKYFILKYKPHKIISFADRRWTPSPTNNLYVKLGFTLNKVYKPEYWYYNLKVDRLKRFHKFGFGKTNIKKRFPSIYDENKTEWEMMQELGYDRIWDCGKLKYELIISE
jgi:hypothetical protein